jgi:hypothetical protein
MEPFTPFNSNRAAAFAWTASSTASYVNGGSFAGTPQPTFHYGQQQFVHHQGNGNHLANHQFQHPLSQQAIQPPCHYQSDAERQQRIKKLKEIVTNPKTIITKLVALNGTDRAYQIQSRLTELIPAAASQIQKNELNIRNAERALRILKEQNRSLKKQVSTFKSSLLPFLPSLNGQDSNVIVSFPFMQSTENVGCWIRARIKTVTPGNNFNKCPPAILQKVFGLTTYSALNDLTQGQLHLILVTLHHQEYFEQQCFKDHIEALKTAKVIKSNFFTRIYHSSEKNLSENTHRALVAIYLDLLGQGMNGFNLKKQNEPTVCPWDTRGDDYQSSQEIKLERERERKRTRKRILSTR